jgi:hypothetical protein
LQDKHKIAVVEKAREKLESKGKYSEAKPQIRYAGRSINNNTDKLNKN